MPSYRTHVGCSRLPSCTGTWVFCVTCSPTGHSQFTFRVCQEMENSDVSVSRNPKRQTRILTEEKSDQVGALPLHWPRNSAERLAQETGVPGKITRTAATQSLKPEFVLDSRIFSQLTMTSLIRIGVLFMKALALFQWTCNTHWSEVKPNFMHEIVLHDVQVCLMCLEYEKGNSGPSFMCRNKYYC
jgi:hypothetical protein